MRGAFCLFLIIGLSLQIPRGYTQETFKNNSVLGQGQFYKLQIIEDGIYKIDHEFLKEAGLDPSNINPSGIRLLGTQTGMLPQANDKLTVDDLKEIPLWRSENSDDRFDEDDYLLFYGYGPDRIYYDENERLLKQELHLYDTANYYFMTTGNKPGENIAPRSSLDRSIGLVSIFDDFIFHEEDNYNIVQSGRHWYGERIEHTETIRFTFPLEGLVPHKTIYVQGSFMSTATSESSMRVSANGIMMGEIPINAVPQTLYGFKGIEAKGEFRVRVDDLTEADQFELSFEYTNENEGTGYLDKFSIRMPRFIQLYGNQTTFQSLTSLNYGSTAFFINNINEDHRIWDITNPLNPLDQEFFIQENGKGVFRTNTDTLRRFVIFRGAEFPNPELLGDIENQNLHALPPADGLIITTGDLMGEARRLASFRKEFNGLDVHVVQIDKVCNEFSGGRQDVTAVRNLVKMLYQKDQRMKYVLLFGDASFSYKKSGNFVPTYQSVNSLHNVHSYASDDYFGFMDPDEGEWSERTSGNSISHDMEIAIGRLPVHNAEEAQQVVDKIIRYESDLNGLGAWRNRIAFIADDGESNKFQLQSDFLATDLESVQPAMNPDRIFVDAFPQDQSDNPVTRKINDQIQNGLLIVDFIGHGGETSWTNEAILTSKDITEWTNGDKLPVFLTATCEFGRFDDPNRLSGAELAVLHPQGGAIGMFTTTRPVFLGTNFELSQAFYRNLTHLLKTQEVVRLGDIMRATKNDSESGVVNRNFSLLGDPFSSLSYPREEIILTDIRKERNTSNDSIFNPLDKVILSGEIRLNNSVDETFDGVVEIKILDKPVRLTTLGEEGPESVMEYSNRKNILFKGKSKVKNGRFEAKFVLPLDIDTLPGQAKISMYAAHRSELRDATGYGEGLKIGGMATTPDTDNTPPYIRPYLNDPSFSLGDLVAANPKLIVELEDEHGINLSTKNGRGIRAVLDYETEIDLTPFYQTDLNRFDRGRVTYDLTGLSIGKHHLAIEAHDNYNNRSVAEIDFFIVDSTQIVLSDLDYFPNPGSECIRFSFRHKNNPTNSRIMLSLFSRDGKLIKQYEEELTYISEEEEYTSDLEVCKSGVGVQVQNGLYYFIFEIMPGESSKNRQVGRVVFSD